VNGSLAYKVESSSISPTHSHVIGNSAFAKALFTAVGGLGNPLTAAVLGLLAPVNILTALNDIFLLELFIPDRLF